MGVKYFALLGGGGVGAMGIFLVPYTAGGGGGHTRYHSNFSAKMTQYI